MTKRGSGVKPYTVLVPCNCCKEVGTILTGEGRPVPCSYCKGAKQREQKRPHPSHEMTDFKSEIRCPGSEPRFYSVRECKACGQEEMRHAAGHFMERLGYPCPANAEIIHAAE